MNRIVGLVVCIACLLLPACREQSKEDVLKQGLEFSKAGNYQAAISLFKDSLDKDPNFLEARLQLGNAYFAMEKFDKAENEYEKALRQDPANKELSLRQAHIFLKTDRQDKALQLLLKLEAASPDDPEILAALGQCYALMGNYPTSEEKHRRALLVSPTHLDSQLGLAQVFIVTNRQDEGMRLLQKVINENPGNVAPHYLLFNLSIRKLDRAGAIASLQKIISINADDIVASYMLGLLYLDTGKLMEGRKVAEGIASRHPEHPAAARIKGLADYMDGNYQQALAGLQTSMKSMADFAGFYFTGLTFYQLHQFEQAVSSFQKALDKQPEHIQSRLMLAQTFLKQGRVDDCIQAAQAVLAKHPQNAYAHNLLGSAFLAQKQYDRAMTHLDKTIELDPGMAQAHLKKGLFNLASGNLKSGEVELQTAVAAAPEVLNNRLLLATHYLKSGNYPLAIKTLKEGLKETPDSALNYNYLAAAYFAQKNNSEALASLNKAKSLKPDYLAPYSNLANYHISRHDYPAAIKEYQLALKAVPGNLNANMKLAGLYELTGDKEQAELHYKQASATGEPLGIFANAAYLARTGRQDQSLEVLKSGYAAHPDDPNLTKALGTSLQNAGQFDEAVKTFNHLEEIAHGSGTPLIIAAYLQQGNTAAANEMAARVVAEQPNAEYGYLLQAAIHEHLKEWAAAEEKLKRGIALCKKNLTLKMKLASTYSRQDKQEQALSLYDEILREQPKFVPAIFAKGAIYDVKGNKAKAKELYEAVLVVNDDYAPALNNLAYLQMDTYGNHKEALRLAIKSFRFMPEDPGVIDTLGYALLKNGQADQAILFLEKAAKLRPNDATIQAHLAQAHKAAGKSAVTTRATN